MAVLDGHHDHLGWCLGVVPLDAAGRGIQLGGEGSLLGADQAEALQVPQVLEGGGVAASQGGGQAVDAEALDAAGDGGPLGLLVRTAPLQAPQPGGDLHPRRRSSTSVDGLPGFIG